VIVGNTVLYGATAGRLFAAGSAGDRFAIRNSGAVAVVEGAGDHCCEYMTAGTVVVLGGVGRNFGAGMSNGVAYVLDPKNTLAAFCNRESVTVTELDPEDEATLRDLIRAHLDRTKSPRVRAMLRDWDRYRAAFRAVRPHHVVAAPARESASPATAR
jgi:glutamate synthase domain-containing protein 3